MSVLKIVIFILILFFIALLYFKLARHFGIVDKPNSRSSHDIVTIRGGGILFPISILLANFFFGFNDKYFVFGLIIISAISFIDDLNPISNIIRLVFHLSSVALLFIDLGLYTMPIYIIIGSAILVIGIINAVNFMDGINGMTGAYALITLICLYLVNTYRVNFIDDFIIISCGISVAVFNFFNFRRKAKCFAGDVGSVGIAFIMIFFIAKLIIATADLSYILFLTVYGLDTITTIFFRVIRHENIFIAHRSHYYQYLANELKIPHIYVSLIYSVVQIIINAILIYTLPIFRFSPILIMFLSLIIFLVLRFYTEGSNFLLKAKNNSVL